MNKTAEGIPQKPASARLLLSFGGILAAVAAASCCVLPFALFVAGVSGAWIANLTALKPYQPIFAGLTFACLGAGYYAVYRKPRAAECVEGSYCANPTSDQIAKIGLWVASVLIVVALGFPHVARLFLTD
ncbi:MAG: mercury transporter MerT [Candidatus Rokubacteria bacterium]|nr:mercury transporter MerT [Candidatus Rokubacteria bacterium]